MLAYKKCMRYNKAIASGNTPTAKKDGVANGANEQAKASYNTSENKKSEVKTITQTRPEIRREWNRRNLKTYTAIMHKEHDRDLIAYMEKKKKEGESISATLKTGVQELIDGEKG